MHEMTIAVELVRQLEALADEHDLEAVEAFTVETGVMRQVVPEALRTAFEIVAEGTRAEGAAMTLNVAPAVAECRQCHCRFEPAVDSFVCPQCRHADVSIAEGNDILLRSVTGQERERRHAS